jgi:hypothetical protein
MARHGRDVGQFRPSAAGAGPVPAGPLPAAGSTSAPDPRADRLRRRRWTPGRLPFRLDLRPAGLVLGVDGNGMSTAFPLLLPSHSTRVGIVGEPGLAHLVALRLLGQSANLTVVTQRPEMWAGVAGAAPVTLAPQLRRWPPDGAPLPWALVIDSADPPQPGFTRAPWSTVVHSAPEVPHGSGWWQSAHLLLTTRAHARGLTALRPRLDTATIDRLTDEDVVAVDQAGVTVFRPSLSEREFQLLTGPQR